MCDNVSDSGKMDDWTYLGFPLVHRIRCSRTTLELGRNIGEILAVYLRLDLRITSGCLQQKFHHSEYFTCNPLITQIFKRFSLLF